MKVSWRSILELVRHFAGRHRLVWVPMLVVLALAALLLVATDGLAVVAPFVYAAF